MTIIFTYGLPTSGKTTIANEIERECSRRNIPCEKASSVENRDKKSTKKFTSQSIDETNPTTRKQKDESYKKLLENAREHLKNGNVTILDATFHKRYRRKWAYELAKVTNTNIICIHCQEPDENTIKRILDERRQNPASKTKLLNTMEQYTIMKAQAEPPKEQENEPLRIITHTHHKTTTVEEVLRIIR